MRKRSPNSPGVTFSLMWSVLKNNFGSRAWLNQSWPGKNATVTMMPMVTSTKPLNKSQDCAGQAIEAPQA